MIVTGAGRRAGIGFAIVRRLLEDGANVLLHSFSARDTERSGGAGAGSTEALLAELSGTPERLQHVEADLGDPDASRRVIEAAIDAFGAVDALVVNHAHSSDQSLETVTVEELDRAWAVNARAAVLLAQAFAERHDDSGPVDTGWPSDRLRERLRPAFSAGRWGRPEDIAPIVAWLVSTDSAWMTGQVIDAEGGFRRQGNQS